MEYEAFLSARRQRMADIIRVAFRRLTPPWFLAGTETVWQHILQVERVLRGVIRDAYAARFSDGAAKRSEAALTERERENLARTGRTRPVGSEPLSVIDYLYLGQLPGLLFVPEIWQDIRGLFGGKDGKQRLQSLMADIAPVRNEIAHVREVEHQRLLRAHLACTELLQILKHRT
jgi:hypothetical protein